MLLASKEMNECLPTCKVTLPLNWIYLYQQYSYFPNQKLHDQLFCTLKDVYFVFFTQSTPH